MTQAAPQATFSTLATAAVQVYARNPQMGELWVLVPTDLTASASSSAVGFSGEAWVNPDTGELIISDRGTVPTNGQNLLSDGQLAVGVTAEAQGNALNLSPKGLVYGALNL